MNAAHVERVYSSYSGIYDVLFGTIFHRSRCHAVDLLGLRPGQEVLEVGVGTGLSLPLYPRWCRVTGIDLSEKMLEKGRDKLRRHPRVDARLIRMDATTMDFEANRFDAVLAAYVMSTVPDPQRTLREMVRVCRPGGTIVLLNHFHAKHPLGARVERWLSPLCRKIGFRSDLDLAHLLAGSGLQVTIGRKVNPFGYWTIVQCVNTKAASSRQVEGLRRDAPLAVSS
jgi:phosphatidylethanolamine/phosphatidyl-N-methylethanolamine N-methyltransferase